MIILLSPAKTLESNPPQRLLPKSAPLFSQEANTLAQKLQKLSAKSLQNLFGINSTLAQLNFERYQNWNPNPEEWPYSPAILTFKGEVYRGIEAWNLSDEDLLYSQHHVLILSGLFGLLRPLDTIQPYRLEMGSNFSPRKGKDLTTYWKPSLTKSLKGLLDKEDSPVLVNLASKEYSKAIDLKSLKTRIIEIQFKDFHNGKYQFLTVYGKHARGLMTRFIVQNRIEDPEAMKAFDLGGYHFNSRLSMGDQWLFTRG